MSSTPTDADYQAARAALSSWRLGYGDPKLDLHVAQALADQRARYEAVAVRSDSTAAELVGWVERIRAVSRG